MNDHTASTALDPVISRYLAHRRALGRQYDMQERTLRSLTDFLVQAGKSDLSSGLFDSWCKTFDSLNSNVRRARQVAVRNFCLYRQRRASVFRTGHQPVCAPATARRTNYPDSRAGWSVTRTCGHARSHAGIATKTVCPAPGACTAVHRWAEAKRVVTVDAGRCGCAGWGPARTGIEVSQIEVGSAFVRCPAGTTPLSRAPPGCPSRHDAFITVTVQLAPWSARLHWNRIASRHHGTIA
jgi:hypothetical protein